MWVLQLTILALLLATMLQSSESRGIWGSRKKKEQVEEEIDAVPNTRTVQRKKAAPTFDDAMGGAADDSVAQSIVQMINMYVEMVENMLDTEQFDAIVTPEAIRTIFSQVPQLAEIPEVQAIINSPQFEDSAVLKQTMREGLAMIKLQAAEIAKMFTDPAMLQQILDQLPPEAQQVIESIKNGEDIAQVLTTMLDSVPGIQPSQKNMLKELLSGNTNALQQELQNALSDGGKIEQVRLQFKENPAMAHAMGITDDILDDPERWAELMSEGMEALMSQGAAAAEGANSAKGKRKQPNGMFA